MCKHSFSNVECYERNRDISCAAHLCQFQITNCSVCENTKITLRWSNQLFSLFMQHSKYARFSKSKHQQHKPFGYGAWLCLFLLYGSRGPLRCTDSQQRSTSLIINQISANCAVCVNIHQLLMFFDCPIFWIPERENRIIDFPIIDDLSVLKLLY